MKKLIYAVLICIIIAGAIITCTIGLKADIIYSKNTQIDIYIGKAFEIKDIKEIVKEIFPDENMMVQKIELFNDMVSITLPDKSEDELKEKVEQLNTKINEKYGIENKAEELNVTHNPKVKLSSIIKPYIIPTAISIIIILVFVAIRYRKLGVLKILASYIISVGAIEAAYLGIIAITRFPINRLVIPIGLLLYVIVLTVLGFYHEKKMENNITSGKDKKKEKTEKN